MKTIRWGVLSTGRIAHQFAQDFASVERGKIAGATSRTAANARAYANRYGIGKVYPNYRALLEDSNIDAVYIATPHSLHLENTLAAIEAGKSVLCEKPITTNAEDCERILTAARDRSVFVMEAMWTWFLPAIRRAKRWFEDGRIGKLVQIKADFGYPQRPYAANRREFDAQLGGGALLEMGIYPVALLWLMLGRQPDRLEVVSKYAPNGVEDDLGVLLDYGDVIATIGTSFRCKLQNWAYLIGEDGYIAIPDFWRASECRLFELDDLKDKFADGRSSIGLNFETQAVIDDLLAGKTESEIVSLSDSLAFQRTMQTIRSQFTASSRPRCKSGQMRKRLEH